MPMERALLARAFNISGDRGQGSASAWALIRDFPMDLVRESPMSHLPDE